MLCSIGQSDNGLDSSKSITFGLEDLVQLEAGYTYPVMPSTVISNAGLSLNTGLNFDPNEQKLNGVFLAGALQSGHLLLMNTGFLQP